jgi:hypothetical protein
MLYIMLYVMLYVMLYIILYIMLYIMLYIKLYLHFEHNMSPVGRTLLQQTVQTFSQLCMSCVVPLSECV